MTEPVTPSVGWGVLHLFCRAAANFDDGGVIDAVGRAVDGGDQVVAVELLGHKSDAAFMALSPDLRRLRSLQTDLSDAGLDVVSSYVSLTEVSEYAQGAPDELKEARLHPQLPPEGKPAWCFYPMSKRRNVDQNWYRLPFDQRKDLMVDHGTVGRKFAGRVLQVVTGSTGLDDFEWGVTLFAVGPDDLKEVVHVMRFDEASATYAEFGPFFVGMVTPIDDLVAGLARGI